MNFKKLFGQRLRAARIAAGFKSQQELADKLRVDTSRVSRWESGANTPDPVFRAVIHKLLGTSDDQLFGVTEAGMAMPDRSELIAAIISLLPALNELELRAVLSQAEESPSLLHKRGSRVVE